MMKKAILFNLVILVLLSVFSCSKDEEKPVFSHIGTWQYIEGEFNGEVVSSSIESISFLNNNELEITEVIEGEKFHHKGTWKKEASNLKIEWVIDGVTVSYTMTIVTLDAKNLIWEFEIPDGTIREFLERT